MFTALETLLYQGFYARFEELVYALSYEEITEKNLNSAVSEAAEEFALNPDVVNDISYVFVPHIFLYPFYVQSYCTSIIPSIELYFMEEKEQGSGLAAYKNLIKRTDSSLTFVETLEDAGLPSPFDFGVVRDIADKIHFAVLGFHYYDKGNGGLDEAA
jgi:oligoendopeptidase F